MKFLYHSLFTSFQSKFFFYQIQNFNFSSKDFKQNILMKLKILEVLMLFQIKQMF